MSDLYNRDIVTWSEQQAALAPVRGRRAGQRGRTGLGQHRRGDRERGSQRSARRHVVADAGATA